MILEKTGGYLQGAVGLASGMSITAIKGLLSFGEMQYKDPVYLVI